MQKEDFPLGEMIEVYTDLGDEFNLGILLNVDDTNILLQNITPLGRPNGLLLDKISDIVKIAYQTQYCCKMKKLLQFDINSLNRLEDCNEDLMLQLLHDVKLNHKMVELQLLQSGCRDVMGFVSDITENTCTIEVIDNYGMNDGICKVSLDTICSIKVDSSEIQNIYQLLK